MILDNFFTGTKSHPICEDYSLIGTRPVPFLIVSDGCSSSQNSDMGSRLLSWITKKQFPAALIYQYLPEDPYLFGRKIIENAIEQADKLGVNRSALDATLLFAYIENGLMNIFCFGDGVIIFKIDRGRDFFIHLSYAENAPYYLTVHQNEQILAEWQQVYPNNALSIKRYDLMDRKQSVIDTAQDGSALQNYYRVTVPTTPDLEMVMLSSDGITSFCNPSDGSMIPLDEVVNEMLDVKVKNGAYIQRRMRKMIAKYASQGVHNMDDVSVAAVIFNEEIQDGEDS
jgi:serine/threonine protein phosphatase PrpC